MPFTKENGCVVYRPANYDKTKQYPCIVLLHGQGERGDGTATGLDNLLNFLTFSYNNLQAALDKSGNYLLVAPQLPTNYSYWPVEYVQKGIDYALGAMNANPKRLYLGFISLGGSGGWKYLSLYSSKFAAAFSICAVQGWSDPKELTAIKCPVWGFHEAGDPIVPASITITAIDTINSANPPVKSGKTIYPAESPMDHFIWGEVFKSTGFWSWLDINQQSSPVPVPATDTPPPTPIATFTAVAEVKNITPTSAILDGSKSTGTAKWQSWKNLIAPPGSDWNVFPNFKNDAVIQNIQNLKPGEYTFRYSRMGFDGVAANTSVTFTVPSSVQSPVFVEKDIPLGKTHFIVREDKSVEFS